MAKPINTPDSSTKDFTAAVAIAAQSKPGAASQAIDRCHRPSLPNQERTRSNAADRADHFGTSDANAKALRSTSLNPFGILETRGDSHGFSVSNSTGNRKPETGDGNSNGNGNGSRSRSRSLLAGRSTNLDSAAKPLPR